MPSPAFAGDQVPSLGERQLMEGIFNLRTRRFGSVAEIMIQKMLGLQAGLNQFHDLFEAKAAQRVEVKSSRVLQKNSRPITADTVLL